MLKFDPHMYNEKINNFYIDAFFDLSKNEYIIDEYIYVYKFSTFNTTGNFQGRDLQFSLLESAMNHLESVIADF